MPRCALLVLALVFEFCFASSSSSQTVDSILLTEPPLHLASVDSNGDGKQEVIIGSVQDVVALASSPTGLVEVACFPHGLTTTEQLIAARPECAYIFVADGVSGISAHRFENFVNEAVGCPDPALAGAKALAAGVALTDRTALAGAGAFPNSTSSVSTRLVALDCMVGGPDDGCGGSLPGLDGETDFTEEPLAIAFTDLDLDGDLDVAALFEGSQSVRFGLTSGQDDFLGLTVNSTTSVTVTCTPQTPAPLCSIGELTLHEDPIEFFPADLDGDGLEDIAAICAEGMGTLSLFRKIGPSHFEGRFGVVVGGGAEQIAALDLDTDGDLDLAAASASTVWTSTQTSLFAFSPPSIVHTTLGTITDLAAADIDGDGCAELLVSETGPPRLVVIAFGASPQFRRGDVNLDGTLNLSDAIAILVRLFTPGAPALPCDDAADSNDDEQLDLADAISLLGYMFSGGTPLPSPLSTCGCDLTGPLGLDCASSSCP